jgi:putative hydrolase of HD superfamily
MVASKYPPIVRAVRGLRFVVRQGWAWYGVPGDTVAEHTAEVVLLSMLMAAELGLDVGRAAAMAAVHDLAEAVVGDLPHAATELLEEIGVDKHLLEEEALRRIGLPGVLLGLFRCYTRRCHREAYVVKAADIASALLEAEARGVGEKAARLRGQLAALLEDQPWLRGSRLLDWLAQR